MHPPRTARPVHRTGGGPGGDVEAAQAVSLGRSPELLSAGASPWARDSCHVWAEGGVADQKLAAGWRPGIGPYPSLPVEEIRKAGTGS